MMALRSKFEPWMKKLVKVPAVGSYLGIPVPKVLPNLFPHDLAICRYYALMRKQRREGLLPPEEPASGVQIHRPMWRDNQPKESGRGQVFEEQPKEHGRDLVGQSRKAEGTRPVLLVWVV